MCASCQLQQSRACHSRVPNLSIWEGTNSVPVSIIIWERALRYVGHLIRAEDTDFIKAVTLEYRNGHWVPPQLSAARTRSRPHHGWAHWAWGEARRAMQEVYRSTSSHIAYFPASMHSQEAHDIVAALCSDSLKWRQLCYVARCLRHQSFLASLRAQRACAGI